GGGGGGGSPADRDGGQKETPAATSATSNTRPAPATGQPRRIGRGRAACTARLSESEGAWFTSARCASRRSRTSAADWKRLSGSLCSSRATMSDRKRGVSRLTSCSAGGSNSATMRATNTALLPWNGDLLVAMAYSKQPRLNRSLRASTR